MFIRREHAAHAHYTSKQVDKMELSPVPPVKRLQHDQRTCPHCNEIVSYKTFRCHKRLYYNPGTGTWFGCSSGPREESSENFPIEPQECVLVGPEEPSPSYELDESESEPCSPAQVSCSTSDDESPPHSDAALSSDHSDVSMPSEPG